MPASLLIEGSIDSESDTRDAACAGLTAAILPRNEVDVWAAGKRRCQLAAVGYWPIEWACATLIMKSLLHPGGMSASCTGTCIDHMQHYYSLQA